MKSYGTIGAASLASPDELVAVAGRAPGDPAVSEAAGEQNYYDDGLTKRAPVSGFAGTKASVFTGTHQGTVLLGVVLLVMPVVVLAAAVGRLGAARREQRLAALRLAGATPRQILAIQVATSPLGVAQQSDPRRTRAVRLVLFLAVLGYIWLSTGESGQLRTRQLLALLALFYGAFWLFGPWVVDRLGRIVGRRAKRPATLLAARRLSDDPRGAWPPSADWCWRASWPGSSPSARWAPKARATTARSR